METADLENFNKTDDPVLQKQKGYSVEPALSEKRPESFTKIKDKVIKVVSLYLQLLWSANPNGKIINVQDLISNCQTLFGTKFETKDIFTIRHVASDLREIYIFIDPTSLKKWYKNIDTERQDISLRLDLSKQITGFLSNVVHLDYSLSYDAAKKISISIKTLDNEDVIIPDSFDKYLDSRKFEEIFEIICVVFICNIYKIFLEFMYNDKE